MFSEKALNLEENELRQQIRNLPAEQRQQYLAMERKQLKNDTTYLWLNWLFFTGINHFYLKRWLRGSLNLLISLAGLYLLTVSPVPLYGALILLAVLIIEIPQMLNARHLVHSRNNTIMYQCLRKVLSQAPAQRRNADT